MAETSTLNLGMLETKYEYQKRFQDDREHWLDRGHGECILKKSDLAEIVANALRHFDHDRYVLDAFVVMPNHVHVLVRLAEGQPLADILHSWKSFSAKAINRSAWEKWPDLAGRKLRSNRAGLERIGSITAITSPAIQRNAKLREGEFVLHD